MAEAKTKQTEQSVEDFLNKIDDAQLREDCFALVKAMKKITGEPAKMWGVAIVGFGKYHYKYESGREGEICLVGFSPRKRNITLYIKAGIDGQEELLKKIGKHKASKGCVYIKKLSEIDLNILAKMIKQTIAYLKRKYPDKCVNDL